MMLHRLVSAFALVIFLAAVSIAQERTTGAIKGKVRAQGKSAAAGVAVLARQGEREIARVVTNSKGEFVLRGLAPGSYQVMFRKPGLRVGTIDNIEVRAGKTRELPSNLFLEVDEGTLAYVRGSVFTAEGRSVPGARVELMRLEGEGSMKRIDGRLTNETGQFVFRLRPDVASYRVTVKVNGFEPMMSDIIKVDGAMIYRTAVSLPPAPK